MLAETLQASPEGPSLSSVPKPFVVGSAWEAAWDALAEPVWLMDAECCIQKCNLAARKLYDGEIVGRHCWEVAHGASEQVSGCPLSKMCQNGHRESTELRIGQRWFNCTVNPLFDRNGKISGAVHVLREISDDVNRRLEAAQSLERERQLLRTLIDLLPDFIFVKDANGRFLLANESLARAYGRSPSELLERTDADFLPQEIAARCRVSEQEVLAGKPVSAWEDTHCFPDGRTRTVVTNMAAFRDAHGAVGGLVGIGRDITNRKRMEETLRKSEESLRRFIENAPVAMAMFDREMKYLAVSQRWLRDYGLEGRNIAGRSHYEIFPEIPEHWKVTHQRALAGEVLRRAEDRFERADGSVHWLRWELQPWFNGTGTIGGIIIFTEDITEHRRAEETVLENEEKFRRLFATVSDAIFVFDAETRKFVEANDAALRLYGYTREELQQLTAMDLTAEPEASEESIGQTKAGLIKRIPLRYHKKKDGTVFPVEIYANTFVLRGKTLYCGVVRDITRRRQTEQLLQKTNRTLSTIRSCHEAMLRAGSERELLESICRIIVEGGGERMAWVGFAEKDPRKTVRPVAMAGISTDHLKSARVTWANTPRGRGPVGTAIRTARLSLCRDTLKDPNFAPWRESARRHGFGSVIALPLMADKQCFGALAIYAPEPDTFDTGEQLMLTDLANDLAFGISTLRLRAERERLEVEILKSTEQEQERIGRDLHDGLCQLLVGAKFRSVYLQKISAAKTRAMLKEARALEEMLGHAIQQARDLARGLNPVKVTPAGLPEALQKLACDVESVHRVHCFCHFPKPVKISDHHVAYHLYRIAQEAVQNAIKHASAKNISITFTRLDHRIILIVKDDGVGIPQILKKTGMGLNNMETRARLIGGRLEIRRRKHGGTAVACELPLHQKYNHDTVRQKQSNTA